MSRSSQLHFHRAFGLDIQSVVPLPALPSSRKGKCDLEIRVGSIEHEIEPTRVDEKHAFWASGRAACHILDDVGAFLVREGSEILVDPVEEVQSELLHLSLIGPALGLALIQRGYFVMHGSTVAFGGQGVSFIGGFAAGKSTLVGGLHRLDHLFVCDDLTAISISESKPKVIPSYPLLKLWPDAARSLRVFNEDLARVHPRHEKRFVEIHEGFAPDPQPLGRIYLLGIGESVAIEPLSGIQRFESVVANWYGGRFGCGYLEALDLATFFRGASLLTREVPVKRLIRPSTLADDPELSEKIAREIVRDLESTD